MISKMKAKESINHAIHRIDQHLAGALDQPIEHFPEEHILHFRKVLLLMRKSLEIDSSNLSDILGFGRIIVDSWPYDSEIGKLILIAEQDFVSWQKER